VSDRARLSGGSWGMPAWRSDHLAMKNLQLPWRGHWAGGRYKRSSTALDRLVYDVLLQSSVLIILTHPMLFHW